MDQSNRITKDTSARKNPGPTPREAAHFNAAAEAFLTSYINSITQDVDNELRRRDAVHEAQKATLRERYESALSRLDEGCTSDKNRMKAWKLHRVAKLKQDFAQDPSMILTLQQDGDKAVGGVGVQRGGASAENNGGVLQNEQNQPSNEQTPPTPQVPTPAPSEARVKEQGPKQDETGQHVVGHETPLESAREASPTKTRQIHGLPHIVESEPLDREKDKTPTPVKTANSEQPTKPSSSQKTNPWTKHPNTAMTSNQKSFISSKLLGPLKRTKSALPFLRPVDPSLLKIPTYYEIIKHPMDLDTLGENLRMGRYASVQHFVKDFYQILRNAEVFNGREHPVAEEAHDMGMYFEEVMEKLPDWRGRCSGLSRSQIEAGEELRGLVADREGERRAVLERWSAEKPGKERRRNGGKKIVETVDLTED